MKKAVRKSEFAVKGFTLIELTVVLAIVGIIAAMALPSFNDMIVKNKVKAAAEDIYGLVLQAKAEAPIRDTDISINTNTTSNPWCVGFSTTAGCDCTNTTSCVVPVAGTPVLQRVTGSDHPDVTITETFAGASTGSTFTKIRGTADLGSIVITSGVWSLTLDVTTQGRVTLCNPNSNNIPGYQEC